MPGRNYDPVDLRNGFFIKFRYWSRSELLTVYVESYIYYKHGNSSEYTMIDPEAYNYRSEMKSEREERVLFYKDQGGWKEINIELGVRDDTVLRECYSDFKLVQMVFIFKNVLLNPTACINVRFKVCNL
uniref:NOT2_3_5 domain-containing protein n=1 Tax=Parastrongyloides trichosuri TaxID=131310 RepID=A0A0N4ZDX7_PARTI